MVLNIILNEKILRHTATSPMISTSGVLELILPGLQKSTQYARLDRNIPEGRLLGRGPQGSVFVWFLPSTALHTGTGTVDLVIQVSQVHILKPFVIGYECILIANISKAR